MSKKLEHKDVAHHMVDHGFESVEGRRDPDCFWEDSTDVNNPITCPSWEWRIKTETITYTVTVPMPMREMPKVGEMYFAIDSSGSFKSSWDGGGFDRNRFHAGGCWATEAEAQEAFEALFGPLRDKK
jgi:hypothetical protein